MKNILYLHALVFAALLLTSCGASKAFQADADTIRLRHLQYYGELIEEFRKKTGKVPLQGRSKLPIYVHVATPEQEKNTKGGPPTPHEVLPFDDLITELEQGLGRKVERHYDPQRVAVGRPNFYIYLVRDETYFFAINLHKPVPFGRSVAKNYHKVEISNAPTGQILAPNTLFSFPSFREAVASPVAKQAFFDEREAQFQKGQ